MAYDAWAQALNALNTPTTQSIKRPQTFNPPSSFFKQGTNPAPAIVDPWANPGGNKPVGNFWDTGEGGYNASPQKAMEYFAAMNPKNINWYEFLMRNINRYGSGYDIYSQNQIEAGNQANMLSRRGWLDRQAPSMTEEFRRLTPTERNESPGYFSPRSRWTRGGV